MQGKRFVSVAAFSTIKSNHHGLAVLANPEFCPYGDKQPIYNLTDNKDFRRWMQLKTELCRKPVKHTGWFECSYVHDAAELQKPKCLYFALTKTCNQGSRCRYQHVALPEQFLTVRPNLFNIIPKEVIEMILLYALTPPTSVAYHRPRRGRHVHQPSTYMTCLTVCKRWLQLLSVDKFENGQIDLPKALKTRKTEYFNFIATSKAELYNTYQLNYTFVKSDWCYFLRCLPLAQQTFGVVKYDDETDTVSPGNYKFKGIILTSDTKLDDLQLDINYKDFSQEDLDQVQLLFKYMVTIIMRAHCFHNTSLVYQLRSTTTFPCPYTNAPDHWDYVCEVKPGCQHTSICNNPVRWVVLKGCSYYDSIKLDDTTPLGHIDIV